LRWRRAALPTAAPHCLSFIRTFDGRSVVRDGSDGTADDAMAAMIDAVYLLGGEKGVNIEAPP
jgi:hypothetical protein